MILFESINLKIEFRNVPCRHLRTTWFGCPVSETYRAGVEMILRCCSENEIHKLLNDVRLKDLTEESDRQFEDQAILQHSKRYGLLYQAVLLSTEIFLKFSSQSFGLDENVATYVQSFFSNHDEALAWLEKQK